MNKNLRHIALSVGLAIALFGCGTGKHNSPSAQDEVGQINAFEPDDKPGTYRSKQGDNLRKIAGRPEVYGDPELWPILAEANADRVGQGTRVNKGTVLAIPRDLSADQMAEAREKARAAAAAAKVAKAAPAPKRPVVAKPEPKKAEPVAQATVAPTPVPPAPVPPARKAGLLPWLLILLLILIALAIMLWFFMKRDREEPKR